MCGRCRRKTGEMVSKLCHSCGVPLHPSCSDEVAARDCELDYGFPVPTGFCSKRCYETDLLAHGNQPQAGQQQQQSVQKRLPHVPNEITAALTVKIGDVSKTSRKQLSLSTFRFLLSEGFEVFKAKANSRTTKELQTIATTESYVRDDRAIYIKPGVHSKQAELVELNEKNFEARVARSYRNFLKRKPGGSEHFECDVLTYVRKDTNRKRASGGKHSTGAVKSTSQLQSFMEYADHPQAGLDASGLSSPIPSAGSLAAMTGDLNATVLSAGAGTKRKHSQILSDVIGNAGGGISSSSGMMLNPPHDHTLLDPNQDPAYKTVRMVMNGMVVPVKVNVRDLLACFGMVQSVLSTTGTSDESGSGGGTTGVVNVHDI